MRPCILVLVAFVLFIPHSFALLGLYSSLISSHFILLLVLFFWLFFFFFLTLCLHSFLHIVLPSFFVSLSSFPSSLILHIFPPHLVLFFFISPFNHIPYRLPSSSLFLVLLFLFTTSLHTSSSPLKLKHSYELTFTPTYCPFIKKNNNKCS